MATAIDPKDFKPNKISEIKVGQRILHLRFGEGLIKSIDERKFATISFDALPDSEDKKIALNYARLQILSPKE